MGRMRRGGRLRVEQAPWLWLCVVPDVAAHEETRSFWNVKENRVEAIAADDDQVWLGVRDPAERRASRSAADRVAALFRHGTTPEHTMPVLTRRMIEDVWVAFAPIRADRFPAPAPAHLLRFLLAHRGGIAFLRQAPGPDTGDYEEELNRLMRESAASQPLGARVGRVTSKRGDDHPDDGEGGGVREPRRPPPDPPPISAAQEADEQQP